MLLSGSAEPCSPGSCPSQDLPEPPRRRESGHGAGTRCCGWNSTLVVDGARAPPKEEWTEQEVFQAG